MSRQVLWHGGAGGHDAESLAQALGSVAADEGLTTTTVTGPDGLRRAVGMAGAGDVVTVHALHLRGTAPEAARLRTEPPSGPDPADLDLVVDWVHRGGSLLALHTAVVCFDGDDRWRRVCGGVWDWCTSWHPPVGSVQVRIEASDHPVVDGIDGFELTDEAYASLDLLDDVRPLASTEVDGVDQPLVWARSVGDGRVVTDLLGHDAASVDAPAHRRLLRQALRWLRSGGAR